MSIGLWAQVAVLLMDCCIGLLGQVIYRLYTGYVLRVELPVQRRLCPIFVRDVGSPGIHEHFRGLTGSQRTPGIGVSQSQYHVVDPTRSMGQRYSLLNEKKMWVDFRVLENPSPRRNSFTLESPLTFCFYFIKGRTK